MWRLHSCQEAFSCTPSKGGREVDATSKYAPLSVYVSGSVEVLYVQFEGGL